jgi:hypothetical protein
MTDEDSSPVQHPLLFSPHLPDKEFINGLSPIKNHEIDLGEDKKSTLGLMPLCSDDRSYPTVENLDHETESMENDEDICNVSKGIDSLDLDIIENVQKPPSIDKANDPTVDFPNSSFSPVKSPKKKKSKKSTKYSSQDGNQFPSNATSLFLVFKIFRGVDDKDDLLEDSMMDTVRAIFKVILKSCNQVGIVGPLKMNLPTIYDNTGLPKKLETRAIRKFVHFGRMKPDSFTGKILIEHSTQQQSDFFSSSPEMVKLMDSRKCVVHVDRFGDCRIVKTGFLRGAFGVRPYQKPH